jgi:hypothetical protein
MWKAENSLRRVKRLNRLFNLSQSAIVRWTLTLIWSAIAASLMLSPSGNGTMVSTISRLFGGTETTDAFGHVIINTILAFLWSWTISLYVSAPETTRLILSGGIIWGLVAELSQHFVPERGTSPLDLGANILGVVIGITVYRWLAAQYSPLNDGDTWRG